jgi:toxin ParE1/3/4
MTGHFVLSPRAQADLDDIWNYMQDRWGLDQAETYTRQLGKDIAIVANRPSLGKDCTEVRQGYRMYPSGSHVLFYRQTSDGIDVIRILHERMDYQRHIP